VTDTTEQVRAATELEDVSGFQAFKDDLTSVNNSTMKPLKRDFSIHVNVDESEYTETQNGVTQERLTGITEESSRSTTVSELIEKHEEETSAYEREEQKYVAEEKEVVSSSFHGEEKEVVSSSFQGEEKEFVSSSFQRESKDETSFQRESKEDYSTSQNIASENIIRSLDNNGYVTEKVEVKEDYLHENMQKLSIQENEQIRSEGGVIEKSSKLEEEHKDSKAYTKEVSESKLSQQVNNEDGTSFFSTESKMQSKEAFNSESYESKHFEQAEIITGTQSFMNADNETKKQVFSEEIFNNQGVEEPTQNNREHSQPTSADISGNFNDNGDQKFT